MSRRVGRDGSRRISGIGRSEAIDFAHLGVFQFALKDEPVALALAKDPVNERGFLAPGQRNTESLGQDAVTDDEHVARAGLVDWIDDRSACISCQAFERFATALLIILAKGNVAELLEELIYDQRSWIGILVEKLGNRDGHGS